MQKLLDPIHHSLCILEYRPWKIDVPFVFLGIFLMMNKKIVLLILINFTFCDQSEHFFYYIFMQFPVCQMFIKECMGYFMCKQMCR